MEEGKINQEEESRQGGEENVHIKEKGGRKGEREKI